MPIVPFESLPDDARVWVFAADHPVHGDRADRLLAEVDRFLAQWAAHGSPLRCARDWRDDRFLTIAVDQRDAHASGCSIDGLFRALKSLENTLGASLVAGGRVFYRDASGAVQGVDRPTFADLGAAGTVGRDTPVFDTSLTSLGEWRDRFETPAGRSWHRELIGMRD
jgi:hypothetical protein